MRRPAAAALALMLLVACSAAQQQVPLPDAGLTLELPRDWELQPARGQTLLFARPTEDGVPVPSAYLQLVRSAQRRDGAGLGSFVDFAEQQARQFSLEYELQQSAETTAAGHPARRQLRRWKGHQRERSELALLWTADGYGYQLTAAAAPAQFEALRSRFERAAASLRAVEAPHGS